MADPPGFRQEFLPENYQPYPTGNLKTNDLNYIDGYHWQYWQAGNPVPPSAVRGGSDLDGTPIYVGKAQYCEDLIPAKVMPDKNVAYVSYNGEEVALYNAQVMCQKTLKWISSNHGQIPEGAVQAGHTGDGEPLFVGRAHHEGALTVGKIHPSHGCCYIPFGGAELSHKYYEILVLTDE